MQVNLRKMWQKKRKTGKNMQTGAKKTENVAKKTV